MEPRHGDHPFEILLVEDDAAQARLATEALGTTRLPVRPHAARNGDEALDFLLRRNSHGSAPRPDLILLGLGPPKSDGHEVLRQIKEHPDLRLIPVVVLTSSRAPEEIALSYDAGANCCVLKPADRDDFVRVIDRTASFWLAHSALPAGKSPSARADPIRILLIEDNPADARLTQAMLKDEDPTAFTVTTATCLRDGLERLSTAPFDAVLLDLTLPDTPPVETLGFLPTRNGGPPVLVLTGLKDEVLAANAIRQGAEDYLVKGQHDGRSLARAVRHALERSRWRNYFDHLAHHDSLTKLPNRGLFQDRLRQALEQARRNKKGLAILFMDLDRFKSVNDTLGHTVGDLLLQCVAERLKASVRASDTFARVGGDEFTLLLTDAHEVEDVVLVAEKIFAAIRAPFLIGPHQVAATASIGASLYPNDGEDADTLLKRADAAMYRAKERGRNTLEFYSHTASLRLTGRGALAQGLRRAIEERQFVLHYQPTIDARGQVVGLEALIRWRHPDWGLIYPLQFIPMAEETGMILDIGDWVVRAACSDRRTWQEGATAPPRVSVNLSSRQLSQGRRLVESLKSALSDHSLDAACLEIEVTENAIAQDEMAAVNTLREISDLGIGVSLDDFGTGHSSLARLKQFPIDGVKIDRSFIHSVPGDPGDTTLVTAMIAMGHGLRLSVLAEGVENGEQMNFLVAHGVDLLQGHYIGRPMPAEACTALLSPSRLKHA